MKWHSMDSAPKDGTRIRVRCGPGNRHEDTARWHLNGLWVAGWASISFINNWQPQQWRHQTSEDDRKDAAADRLARHKELNKMTNSDEFVRRMDSEYDKAFKK